MLSFPNTISLDLDTRAGRMLQAGNVTVTVTSHKTGEHMTLRFRCIADNRQRQYKQVGKNWVPCPYADATHVFIEVPNPDGWADKVGTFYPTSSRFYDDRNADPARVYAAKMVAHWLNGEEFTSTIQEETRCGKCSRTLTDPVSIARGIGPDCLGAATGSQHVVKTKASKRETTPTPVVDTPASLFDAEVAARDRDDVRRAADAKARVEADTHEGSQFEAYAFLAR